MTHQHIAITGGSKGLGLGCTRSLLANGAHVYVLSRSQGQLEELQAQYKGQLHWFEADLANSHSIEKAFSAIGKITSTLDGLILNAVLTEPMLLEDMTADKVDKNLAVNISGPIACLRLSLPLLGHGRAIFISTESVETPFSMLSLYAAVKASIETLLKGIRAELLERHNIQLTVLRAGSMEGTSFSESWSQETITQFYAMAESTNSLKKSGTAMPVDRVVSAINYVLALPWDANVSIMDVRSKDAV